jgi:hypothetical protein
MMAAAGLE